ncbi:MAG: M23 family metallopeptidase [Spirochaetales bacterium]|nr:M23 family metallopeptidase [Spirochaetales bacterium]
MKNLREIPFRGLFFLFGIVLTVTAYPLFGDYPEIKTLTPGDPLYKQLQADVSAYYRASSSNGKYPFPALSIFQYVMENNPEMDIFSLSAHLNLPYDTIATLNHINNPGFFHSLHTVLIPNIPGLFIPERPVNELDHIVASWRMQSEEISQQVTINRRDKKEIYLFFPGKRFHPVERVYFLSQKFIFPLPKGRITSVFGRRQSPFTGHKEVHNGIDIGAKEGSDVLAARAGKVIKCGYDKIYGNYVLIAHDEGYQSFYGHLKDFYVHLHMKVYSGMVIGRVGTTGRSTGPHLHFEIKKNGSYKDPLPFFR